MYLRVSRHEVIWRKQGQGGCRLPCDWSSYLILAVHFHSLPNAAQVRMKVSWLRFHPDTTGSSMIKQIVHFTPTASWNQSWPLAQWGSRQDRVESLLRLLPPLPLSPCRKPGWGIQRFSLLFWKHPGCGNPKKAKRRGLMTQTRERMWLKNSLVSKWFRKWNKVTASSVQSMFGG